MDLDKVIRKVENFPKKGILFYDVTSIFTNPEAFHYVVEEIKNNYDDKDIDGIIAIESRGFLLGSCYALHRKVPLVLARKKGKLPGETWSQNYELEYGEEVIEIHKADLLEGKIWLIVDDLIATGGTLEAVSKIIEKAGGSVAGVFGIIGLPFLQYKDKIGQYNTTTLIDYEGE